MMTIVINISFIFQKTILPYSTESMLMVKAKILSHKIRLYPNEKQEEYFRRACGIKRFAYNWALETSSKYYNETGKSLSGYDLSKRLTLVKREHFLWMYEVTKWASQKAVFQFADAMQNFFKKRAGFPKFKKKGRCRESFYLAVGSFKIEDKKLEIPKLEPIKMSQKLRFSGRPLSVTISETAGKWFVSIHVELDDSYIYPHACETQDVCGIDLGVKDLAVFDDGTKILAPRSYRKREKKLKRLQRSLSRKKNGSKNRIKAIKRLALQHLKVKNSRQDFTHKITTQLVKNNRYIGIEDLNVNGMMKNKKLSKSVQDAGFYEFRRQLEYKSDLSGSKVIVADRFYPSTKMCSVCGEKVDLSLSKRKWKCNCGAEHDRDVNAAINLRNLAVGQTDNKNVCGEGSSGIDHQLIGVKLSSVKQKLRLLVEKCGL